MHHGERGLTSHAVAHTSHLDPSKEHFNARLSSAHMIVEGAFRYLKAYFRSLLTPLDVGEWNISQVVVA